VGRTRQMFVEGVLDWALRVRSRPRGRRKLAGGQEAYLVATACSARPDGLRLALRPDSGAPRGGPCEVGTAEAVHIKPMRVRACQACQVY
jgi:hypothetical protein